jgi:hypothetical protein
MKPLVAFVESTMDTMEDVILDLVDWNQYGVTRQTVNIVMPKNAKHPMEFTDKQGKYLQWIYGIVYDNHLFKPEHKAGGALKGSYEIKHTIVICHFKSLDNVKIYLGIKPIATFAYVDPSILMENLERVYLDRDGNVNTT